MGTTRGYSQRSVVIGSMRAARRAGRNDATRPPPFRTVLGFQASHVDVDFYDRFYRPEALSETQRRHMERWHGGA